MAAEDERQRTLHPADPEHHQMFAIDLELGYVDLYWGGYEYSFELSRLDTPMQMLAFIEHVGTKTWQHMTPDRIALFIRAIARHFQWDLHGPDRPALAARTTSAAEERAKLTPSLRYDVLLRDDFRCRACGFSVESGAHLHIDHVTPVSKGGRTELNNLQALCSVCNMGKGAKCTDDHMPFLGSRTQDEVREDETRRQILLGLGR